MNRIRYLLAVCLLLPFFSGHAATLQYTGDQVTAVTGLEVNGGIYDALFFDGSYDQMLAAYPTAETNYSDAFAEIATTALFNFASIDPDFAGLVPTDINGCSGSQCYLATAVNQNSLTAWYVNMTLDGLSMADSSALANPGDNYSNVSHILWQTSIVPVPAAIWLFGSGLLGLIGVARRKKL